MKTLKLPALIVATVISIAAFGQGKTVPTFTAKGTDGKSYSAKDFKHGKPILLTFFSAGCPHNVEGIKDMNKLDALLQGKVRLLGMTNLDAKQAKILAANHHARFPILADPTGMTIGKFGGQAGLDNALILPDGRVAKVWNGYNRSTLKQFEVMLGQKTNVKLSLALNSFPKDREIGCAIGMNM